MMQFSAAQKGLEGNFPRLVNVVPANSMMAKTQMQMDGVMGYPSNLKENNAHLAQDFK